MSDHGNDKETRLVPMRYVYNTAALMALLGVTLLIYEASLGTAGVLGAIVVAAVKALLVALYFMHLAPARGSTRLFAAAGLVWLTLLIGLTLCDVLMRM
jgi:cytochrome c oxidase subunit 4